MAQSSFAHFEGRQTHPIGLTPDGTKLLALNTPDARLSVFAVSNPANPLPVLVAEIAVGLEPVSLCARTDDEVWIVNEVSDSVSIVSLNRGVVVATLPCADEPADVVFAQGKAFVSCARNNPHRPGVDQAYRQLEAKYRSQNCTSCHAPDNKGKAKALLLLNFPNQSMAARHTLVQVLSANEMSPEDREKNHPAGIADHAARGELIRLAKAFVKKADAAVTFESSRKADMKPQGK